MNFKTVSASVSAPLCAIVCGLVCSALCGCSASSEATKTVFAMDTEMTLKAYGKNAPKALGDAETEIKRLDALLRRGSAESEIYKVNHENTAEVSDITAELTRKAIEICESTDGAFDITIAPVMDLWGFYTKDFRVPEEKELAETLEVVNFRNVSVSENTIALSGGAQLDLGGIAKGFLSERLMEIYKSDGVNSGIISLGGNVQALGSKPNGEAWRVAVLDPDGDGYIGSVAVRDKAVVTSGGYQRYFEENGRIYHHIIDPKTGQPAESGVKSVTIISENGTEADGLSTAVFVMGLDRGTQYWRNHGGFDIIFVTDEGEIYVTEGIEFESEREYTVIRKQTAQ